MSDGRQITSDQGENVILALMGVGLLVLVTAGFAFFQAPLEALLAPVPLILLCLAPVRKDLLHVRRHGWTVTRGTEGPSNGEGGRPRPEDPTPRSPSGGDHFDWDGFVTEFWDHVERTDREPVAH